MNKTKLAIYMNDLEYQNRFVSCFMNHYNRQYELHVFTDLDQLQKVSPKEYAVIITGECSTEEMENYVEKGRIILNLVEDYRGESEERDGNIVCLEKYQEVYKIAEAIERFAADIVQANGGLFSNREYTCIGVYSLTQEMNQMPFAALLGTICGEKEKVLLLDLQGYSGLSPVEEGMGSMGLEDLLSTVTTGNYSRGRMLECIRHGANWDYVCPSQNMESLAEGTQELYGEMLRILVEELGYQKIIINFGTIFLGRMNMMEQCQTIYLLQGKEAGGAWREEAFFREAARRDKEVLLQRIKKVELPHSASRDGAWQSLVEKWNWTYIGEFLRQEFSKEKMHESVM